MTSHFVEGIQLVHEHLGHEPYKYTSAVAIGNDVISAPCNASQALRVDARTETVTFFGPKIEGEMKYIACVQVGTSVFGIPAMADKVLHIDTTTWSVELIGPALPLCKGNKYIAAAVCHRKKVAYAFPDMAKQILRIDCSGKMPKVSLMGPEMGDGDTRLYAEAYALGISIYGIPMDAKHVACIDASCDEVIDVGPEVDCWYGSSVMVEGKVLAFPQSGHGKPLLSIDASTRLVTLLDSKLDCLIDCIAYTSFPMYAYSRSRGGCIVRFDDMSFEAKIVHNSSGFRTAGMRHFRCVAVLHESIYFIPLAAHRPLHINRVTGKIDRGGPILLEDDWKYHAATVTSECGVIAVPSSGSHIMHIRHLNQAHHGAPHEHECAIC